MAVTGVTADAMVFITTYTSSTDRTMSLGLFYSVGSDDTGRAEGVVVGGVAGVAFVGGEGESA